MNKTLLKDTIDKSLAGTITFPQVVGALLAEGIESYHVDIVRNENRYYTSNGESHVEKTALVHSQPAQEFSAVGVEAAVKKVQAGKSTYQQFMEEIMAAGCVYYVAYLAGKRVSYFGRLGDCHLEMFPQPK